MRALSGYLLLLGLLAVSLILWAYLYRFALVAIGCFIMAGVRRLFEPKQRIPDRLEAYFGLLRRREELLRGLLKGSWEQYAEGYTRELQEIEAKLQQFERDVARKYEQGGRI